MVYTQACIGLLGYHYVQTHIYFMHIDVITVEVLNKQFYIGLNLTCTVSDLRKVFVHISPVFYNYL